MTEKMYESIVLLDDHPVTLNGLKSITEQYFNKIFGSTDLEAGQKLILVNKPEMVIIDSHFINTNSSALCREIKYRLPKTKIMAFAFEHDETIVGQFLNAGINGFMLKKHSQEDLIKAFRTIMGGTNYFCKEVKPYLLNRMGLADHLEHIIVGGVDFSKNELETMKMLCYQKSTKQISEGLCLSTKTIDLYRSNLIKKTNSKNIVGVVRFALKAGVIKLAQM